jgi:hypothetical protein
LDNPFAVSNRLQPSWVVFDSLENAADNRYADAFARPDGSFGFEEFRREPEDQGAWMPVRYYSGASFASREAALASARQHIPWLSVT